MSIGAVGAVGAVGPSMSVAPMGSVSAASPAASGGIGAPSSAQSVSPGTQVTISAAAQKAMATDNQQVGMSFSISTDGTGHHYSGNVDANGFSINVAGGAPSASNDSRLDDLVAAVLLALLLKDKQ